MRIAIVAGGTGGHIYPGIALADEFMSREPRAEIVFLGGAEGLESELVARAGYRLELIRARALTRKLSYQALSAPFISLLGFFQALAVLKRFAPRALVSTGGYASLPVVAAAKLLGIPIYLQEQNLLPGFTNRLYRRWARQIFLSFEGTKKYMDGVVTGNPVRREILAADRAQSRRALGYGPDDKVVFIMGGSQGARSLNLTVVGALPLISPASGVKIIHVVGKRDAGLVAAALGGRQYAFYQRVEYLYNVSERLAAADLAVSRAGATAIAEFTALGLPMVLVPFPFSAAGHQELNAELVAAAGAGWRVKNEDFTSEKFAALASGDGLDLKTAGAAAKRLGHPQAARQIVDLILADNKG